MQQQQVISYNIINIKYKFIYGVLQNDAYQVHISIRVIDSSKVKFLFWIFLTYFAGFSHFWGTFKHIYVILFILNAYLGPINIFQSLFMIIFTFTFQLSFSIIFKAFKTVYPFKTKKKNRRRTYRIQKVLFSCIRNNMSHG